MIIVETSIFTRLIQDMMSDDDYRSLQEALIIKPDTGNVIKGSGGLRKVRWKLRGKGKSGGVRIIYYWVTADDEIRMIYAYRKSQQENLTSEQLALLKQLIEKW